MILLTLNGLSLANSTEVHGEDAATAAITANGNEQDPKLNDSQRSPKSMQISGDCLDEEKKPIEGVKAKLFRRSFRFGIEIEIVGETQTDASGEFRFENVASQDSDDFAVALTSPGRASTIFCVETERRISRRTIVLYPSAAVSGRITDVEGKPIAGAWVWTQGLTEAPLEGIMSGVTDADGRYSIPDLSRLDTQTFEKLKSVSRVRVSAIHIYIRARHPDYVTELRTYSKAPDSVNFVLKPGGSVEGRVDDTVTGTPAADVAVILRSVNREVGDNILETRTDHAGRYKFTGVTSSNYALVARAPERVCVSVTPIHVEVSKTSEVPNLELIQGALVTGKVLGHGAKPVTHDPETDHRLKIGLHGPSYPDSIPGADWVCVDNEGQFQIRVAPGLNKLSILSNGNKLWRRTQNHEKFDRGIEVSAGETRRVLFRVLPEPDLSKFIQPAQPVINFK